MKKNTLVTIKREELSTFVASTLPEPVFWNETRVVKYNAEVNRCQVKVLGEKYWFDADALEIVC